KRTQRRRWQARSFLLDGRIEAHEIEPAQRVGVIEAIPSNRANHFYRCNYRGRRLDLAVFDVVDQGHGLRLIVNQFHEGGRVEVSPSHNSRSSRISAMRTSLGGMPGGPGFGRGRSFSDPVGAIARPSRTIRSSGDSSSWGSGARIATTRPHSVT